MELNWSTFVLEIVNFLVLLWILKRFLYQPVLAIIARRQQSIQDSLSAAQKMQNDARATQQQYDSRLHAWQQEREHLRATLQHEMATEREHRLQVLQDELQQQRDKAKVLEERQRQAAQRALEQQALQQGAQFAAKFLQPFATPALEAQLLELAAQRIEALHEADIESLRSVPGRATEPALVATAFALSADRQSEWRKRVTALCGCDVPVQFIMDSSLGAGIRITLGAWMLKANLSDELAAFALTE